MADEDSKLRRRRSKTSRQSSFGLQPGDILAKRFRLVRLLGRGGMGEVYEAHDLELDVRLALKAVRSDLTHQRAERDRLRSEVVLARRVTHPNVCRTFDLWRSRVRGHWVDFVTMELLNGETLEQSLARNGPLSLTETQVLARELLGALGAAHRAGVVHRDLKTANVLLVPTDGGNRAFVTDFGLALRAASHGASSDGAGTPATMAPEQLSGLPVGPPADLYALGVVLYEALTGRLPFETKPGGPIEEILQRRLRDDVPSPRRLRPEIDVSWEAALLRCLERDPEKRFPSCEAMERALGFRRAADARGIAVLPPRGEVLPPFGQAPFAESGSEWPWTALFHELLVRLLSRGSTLRVPKLTDFERAQRDLGLTDDRFLGREPDRARLARSLDVDCFVSLTILGASKVEQDPLPSSTSGASRSSHTTAFLLEDRRGESSSCRRGATRSLGTVPRAIPSAEPRSLRLQVRLIDARSGVVLYETHFDRTDDDWVRLAEDVSNGIRIELSLDPLAPNAEDRVLAYLPRVEARRPFAEGLAALARRDLPHAVKALREAVAKDPESPSTHAALADALEVCGEQASAAAAARQALLRAGDLERREQIELEARERSCALDRDRAEELYRALLVYHPDVPEYALRLASIYSQSGRGAEARKVLSELRAHGAGHGDLRIETLEVEIAVHSGESREGIEAAGRLRRKAESLGAVRQQGRAAQLSGIAWSNIGEPMRAIADLLEAQRLFRQCGDHGAEVYVQNNLGTAAQTAGMLDEAADRFRVGIRLSRELGLDQSLGAPVHNLATVNEQRGDLDEALRLYAEALEHHRTTRNTMHEGVTLSHRAAALALSGDREEALRLWSKALELVIGKNPPVAEAYVRCSIGSFLVQDEQNREGIVHLERGLEAARRCEAVSWIARLLAALAIARCQTAEITAAVDLVEESTSLGFSLESIPRLTTKEDLRTMLDHARVLHQVGRDKDALELVTAVERRSAKFSFEAEQRAKLLRVDLLVADPHTARTLCLAVRDTCRDHGFVLLVRQAEAALVRNERVRRS